jgi:hypothetical protein
MDQRKGQRASDLVEVETQKEVCAGVGASFGYRALSLQCHLFTTSGFSQGGEQVSHETPYVH